MKNIFLSICLLALVSALVSCEKEIETYEGGDGIYFDPSFESGELLDDTINVHWGLKKSDVTSQKVALTVKLFGNTAPYDRKFTVRVETDPGDEKAAQEGVDYDMIPLEYVMEAGKAETIIEVNVLRRQGLKDTPRRFRICLEESDELKFRFTRSQAFQVSDMDVISRPIDLQRVILIDENFPAPIWWEYRGYPYFGSWSQTKAALICDVMDIDREDWIASNVLTQGYLKFCGAYMHLWLTEQNEKNPDNPILDENGEPMEMGRVSQQ